MKQFTFLKHPISYVLAHCSWQPEQGCWAPLVPCFQSATFSPPLKLKTQIWKKRYKEKGFLASLSESQSENQASLKTLPLFIISKTKLIEGHTERFLLQISTCSKRLYVFLLCHSFIGEKLYIPCFRLWRLETRTARFYFIIIIIIFKGMKSGNLSTDF